MDNQQQQPKVNLKIEPMMEQGVYSNAVSITVSGGEVTIDYGYMLPNQEPTTIKLVSRVIMNPQTAKSLMAVLTNAMLDWSNKNKIPNA